MTDDEGALHVVPTADLIGHTISEDCVCIPTCTYVDDGWFYTHHSLDGRELREERV